MSGGARFSWRLLLWGLLCLLIFLVFVFCAYFAFGLNTVARTEDRSVYVSGPNHK